MHRAQAAANEGQTRPPAPDEVVALHFVALVEREGQLWELDGRKSGPVAHGPTSRDTLLQVGLPLEIFGRLLKVRDERLLCLQLLGCTSLLIR